MPLSNPNVALRNAANTYTTGAQSLAAASSLLVPAAAGSAPTADGDLRYDSTQDAFSAGGAGAINGLLPRVVSLSHNSSDTLTASVITTTETAFAQKFTVPANFWVSNKTLRVSGVTQFTTGAVPPTITYRVRVGGVAGTIVWSFAAQTPIANITNGGAGLCVLICGTAAPGASVSLIAGIPLSPSHSVGVPVNTTAQPVAGIATTGALDVVVTVQFSGAGTGVTTETLLMFMVEELTGQP